MRFPDVYGSTTGRKSVKHWPSLNKFPPNTHNMNKQQISILWVVALIIDTATLVALCVGIGLIW